LLAGKKVKPLALVADTIPETAVLPPAFKVTLVAVRLFGSIRESVATRIPARESGDTAEAPFAGATDNNAGEAHADSAKTSVAAVCDVPLGQVTVTVAGTTGVTGVVEVDPPPPPQAVKMNVTITTRTTRILLMIKLLPPKIGFEILVELPVDLLNFLRRRTFLTDNTFFQFFVWKKRYRL
jgi:hypothetical protein